MLDGIIKDAKGDKFMAEAYKYAFRNPGTFHWTFFVITVAVTVNDFILTPKCLKWKNAEHSIETIFGGKVQELYAH